MLEIFISDIHYPFEDRLADRLVKNVIKDIQPDLLFMGGDILDFYAVSDFSKEPTRALQFQEELDYGIEKIGEMRQLIPGKKVKFMPGNHVHRIERYLTKKAPELKYLDCLQLDTLLGLREMEIELIPHATKHLIGDLYHLHGDEKKLGYSDVAKKMYMRLQANVIFGHFHKLEKFVFHTYDGERKAAYSNPCLCSFDVEFDHCPQWVLGFSVIEYTSSGKSYVNQIEIYNEKDEYWCEVKGKKYSIQKSEIFK